MSKTIFQFYKEQLEAVQKQIPEIIEDAFQSITPEMLEDQQVRLKDKGEYVDGFKLQTNKGKQVNKAYSPRNEQKAGRKTVDLYDTGTFYDSMKVIAKSMDIVFSADFDKEDSHISDNFRDQKRNAKGFVQSVLGITAEDWNELAPEFVSKFIELFILRFNNLVR